MGFFAEGRGISVDKCRDVSLSILKINKSSTGAIIHKMLLHVGINEKVGALDGGPGVGWVQGRSKEEKWNCEDTNSAWGGS